MTDQLNSSSPLHSKGICLGIAPGSFPNDPDILRRELNCYAQRQAVFYRLSLMALSNDTVETLCRATVAEVAALMDAAGCRLLAYLPTGQWLLRGFQGWPGIRQGELLKAGYASLAEVACHEGRLAIAESVASDARIGPGTDYHSFNTVASAVIPGVQGTFGVLELAYTEPRIFTPSELDFLQALADLIGTAVERNKRYCTPSDPSDTIGPPLSDSEARFRMLVDLMPVLVGLSDAEGHAVYYNRACQAFAQESSESLVVNSWLRVVHPDDRQQVIDVYSRAMPQRQPFGFEYRAIRHDGEVHCFMNTGVPRMDEQGEFLGYVLLAVDVTTEKQSADRFQRILDSNMIGVILAGPDGGILECNQAFLDMVGYTLAELQTGDLDLWDITAKDYLDMCHREVDEYIATGRSHTFEKQYVNKDGHRVDVLASIANVTVGKTGNFIVLVQDISPQKQAQRALQKSLDRERLNRSVLEITNQSKEIDVILAEVSEMLGRELAADRCVLMYFRQGSDTRLDYDIHLCHEYRSSEAIVPFEISDFPSNIQQGFRESIPHLDFPNARIIRNYEEHDAVVGEYLRGRGASEDHIAGVLAQLRQVNVEHFGIQSYVRYFIEYRGKVYGSLLLHHCGQADAWSEEQLDLLESIIKYLGAAIYQMELHDHEQATLRALEKSYELINIISQAQTHFITNEDNQAMFKDLLNRLLAYTDSDYGFIGELQYDAQNQPYLKTRFLTDISWNEDTRRLYQENFISGMEFHNLKTLFGQVMTTGKRVVSNDPATDPRRGGLPQGHPPLNAFLGLPIYKGEQMLGMIGIANRPGGYDEALAEELEPYLSACANILAGIHSEALKERLTQELRLSEQAMKNYASRLERSNNELEQFATIASHDLQAPLRKVVLFSDYLATSLGDALPDESRDYLTRIQKSTRKMQSLISDLLALSRVNRRGKPFVPVDLREIADEVIIDLEEVICENVARIEIGEMMTIDADCTQMHQVFQNLIANALKFHKADVPPIVQVSAIPISNALCQITVKDNGIGFDEKYLERIFTIFERLHGEHEYEGTGMGLAIVKKIAERHGGTVTAQSKPGQGATFIITLPIHQP